MKRSKKPVYLIFLFCLMPVVFSWIAYISYGHVNLHTSNMGVLINPPLQVSFVSHKNGAWQIVYIPEDSASKETKRIIANLESVRKLQGENDSRVGVTVLQKTSVKLQSGQIYLVDPQDNLFMSYKADVNPMSIFKDLKRVLNVSQIG